MTGRRLLTTATIRGAIALLLLAAASTLVIHAARHRARRYHGPAVLIPPLELDADHAEVLHATRGIPRSLPPTSTTSTTRRPASTTTTAGLRANAGPSALPPAGGRRYLGRFRVTCYGPPRFYAGKGTASGEPVGWGSIAASPAVVPRGTSLELGPPLNTTGHVNDTGVTGRTLDLWRPSCASWPNPTVDVWAV